jgi:hypothetical protein
MRKLVLAASMFMFTSGLAFAAKAHRDAANEINPKIKEATATVKSGCGCAPGFAWDMKSFEKTPADKADEYKSNIQREFEDLAKTAKEFCSDAASKKLFCSKVKKVQIFTKASGDPETKFANGVFSVTTTNQMSSGGYGMKSEMEKW